HYLGFGLRLLACNLGHQCPTEQPVAEHLADSASDLVTAAPDFAGNRNHRHGSHLLANHPSRPGSRRRPQRPPVSPTPHFTPGPANPREGILTAGLEDSFEQSAPGGDARLRTWLNEPLQKPVGPREAGVHPGLRRARRIGGHGGILPEGGRPRDSPSWTV